MENFDAILIPGGGIREEGELPIWVKRRFDRVIDIFNGEYIITLSAGTSHKPPPLYPNGFPIFESVAGAKYLINRGIPMNKILIEKFSYDTIGNAFFARVVHTDPRKFSKLLVITSEFHLTRTKAIFEWVFNLSPLSCAYELAFEAVSDEGIDDDILSARKIAEKQSLNNIKTKISVINTLFDFHNWLFTQHDAYSSINKTSILEKNNNLIKSY